MKYLLLISLLSSCSITIDSSTGNPNDIQTKEGNKVIINKDVSIKFPCIKVEK